MSIVWILAWIVTLYLIAAIYLYVFQARFIYYPNLPLSIIPGTPKDVGLDYEDISFISGDGVKLNGWYISRKDALGIVLFCHGNAGNIGHRLESVKLFNSLGLEVFIFDYRGYGMSDGKPSEAGTYRVVEAAWNYLIVERKIQKEKIIVFGRSLGGAIASWLATRNTPGALILESSFTSIPDIAASRYWFMPIRLLMRIKYNTASRIAVVKCPTLVIHSQDDEEIPFIHGKQLFQLALEPKQFLEISGTHNEGFITSGKQYTDGLYSFLRNYILSL